MTWYTLFKFLHVAAVSVWFGGAVVTTVAIARSVRDDVPSVRAVARLAAFIGPSVLGPSAGISLVTGIVLLGLLNWHFQFWIIWGLSAVVISIALGATLLRRAQEEWAAASSAANADPLHVAALRRRLVMLNLINIVVLVTTVWFMVFKTAP